MLSSPNVTLPPKLQPPGAGLPFIQMLAIKLWLAPVVSRRTHPAESRSRYEAVTGKLIGRVSAVPSESRNIKILVQPIAGLEDSSRFWSLNGLMEHLLIVSKGIESTILGLASGNVPDGMADTAKVKPTGAEQNFFDKFKSYAPGLMARIDEKLKQPEFNFNSRLRFRHPWFGPLTARQWYWVLGSHQAIHYRQAKDIIAGLGI